MSKRVGIIGSGLCGRAWAISFARGGYDVRLFDLSPDATAVGLKVIMSAVNDLEQHDLLHGATVDEVLGRIRPVDSVPSAVDGAVYVQENVPDRLPAKLEIFAQLDELATPETVLASSTSGIVPSAFTEELKGRRRCLVVHPINPPYLVPACDVVPSPWTDPAIVERACVVLKAIGQTPLVMNRELPGFIMNRLQGALKHEAFRLVAGGYATSEEVDRGIAEGIGLRWSFIGVFETAELNAPGGIRDYAKRYGPVYDQMAQSLREPVPWAGPVLDQIEAERTAALPRDQIAERQQWRDRRLMALARHKRDVDAKLGK